jgi:hypothetical protein
LISKDYWYRLILLRTEKSLSKGGVSAVAQFLYTKLSTESVDKVLVIVLFERRSSWNARRFESRARGFHGKVCG